jgi:Mg2+/Co2+ transporter CorB
MLTLLYILLFLLVLSAFFSSAETAMTSLNAYKLKHFVAKKNTGAMLSHNLLKHPTRLISMILIGNNIVNISASALATTIAIQLWGESSIVWVTAALTVCILLFSEIIPKSIAVTYPEKVAFPASYILTGLMKVMYPLVWLINFISDGLLRLIGIKLAKKSDTLLNRDQLRTVVLESGGAIPRQHRKMLLSMLDLNSVTVEEIMIPHDQLDGINLADDITQICKHIINSKHSALIVYQDKLDNCVGFLETKHCTKLLLHDKPTKKLLLSLVKKSYFIPGHLDLYTQLVNFRMEQNTLALVVNEYGDIQGMLTLIDILKEIMGDFHKHHTKEKGFYQQEDGSYVFNGNASVRDINSSLGWSLPQAETITITGLVLEQMGAIPSAPVCIQLDNFYIEILSISNNTIDKVKITATDIVC